MTDMDQSAIAITDEENIQKEMEEDIFCLILLHSFHFHFSKSLASITVNSK